MKRLHFSVDIKASRETIWSAIISHERYKYWTKFFSEGSDFVGGWQKGDAIQFVTVDEDGAQMGMSSEIAESIHLQHISIRHLGMIKDGVEDRTSPEAMKWTPAYENYYLEDTADEKIHFRVETDMEDEYIEYMSQIWPTALDALRSICEDNLLPFTPITIETVIPAALEKVWDSWTSPEAVTQWNFASPDWYCPKAVNHLAMGEKFVYTMAARDGSMSFDFSGIYTQIDHHKLIRNQLDDGRMMTVIFESIDAEHTKVIETFEAEDINTLDLQKQGWQAILDNFRQYVIIH